MALAYHKDIAKIIKGFAEEEIPASVIEENDAHVASSQTSQTEEIETPDLSIEVKNTQEMTMIRDDIREKLSRWQRTVINFSS